MSGRGANCIWLLGKVPSQCGNTAVPDFKPPDQRPCQEFSGAISRSLAPGPVPVQGQGHQNSPQKVHLGMGDKYSRGQTSSEDPGSGWGCSLRGCSGRAKQ